MRYLHDLESAIRTSEFWRGKPRGALAAIQRIYLTGAGDCGGSSWADDALGEEITGRIAGDVERNFKAMWKRDQEHAKAVDWSTAKSKSDRG
ncbi:hypothetical protein CK215_15805 [Mesorhizobium sp. WSM3864]|nr:hypothetical protein CK215_15805 [Mesorhizobium sp. WSM3864]